MAAATKSSQQVYPQKDRLQSASGFYVGSGGDLLSRAVTSQVPSALKGLTSVFGMGTGVTPSSLPPEMVSKFRYQPQPERSGSEPAHSVALADSFASAPAETIGPFRRPYLPLPEPSGCSAS